MQHRHTPDLGGGKFEYLTPELTILDIAVEQGFAKTAGEIEDITYDSSWENANQ